MNANVVSFLALAAAIGILAVSQYSAETAPAVTEIRFVSDDHPRQERIMELPEDGDMWSTIVVYGGESKLKGAENRTLAANFGTTPRLQSLKEQTKFYEMPANHWWVLKYHPGEPLPLVIVQMQNGRTVYKNSGDTVPRDGEMLADEIEDRITDCCPDTSPKKPDGKPDPTHGRIPILRPTGKPSTSQDSLIFLIGALGIGAAAAFLQDKSKE